ncbi:MAG TPA: hypothetical protein VFX92_02870 [Candidatus Krumholzibacteria bacterium]|nr:hypothetical protein [Candidatus Krumholzibacteria bacterium]
MQSRIRTLAGILALSVLAVGLLAGTGVAQVNVSEVYTVDPFYESGGYYEFTVDNNSGDDLYFVAVGNTGGQVVFTRPDLVGVWGPDYCYPDSWGPDCPSFYGVSWTPPDLSGSVFSDLFGASEQVLTYVAIGGTPIANGTSFSGFRWMPPAPNATAAPATTAAGSPFAVYNGNGELVAQGTTSGSALATESRTWGGVKALYR